LGIVQNALRLSAESLSIGGQQLRSAITPQCPPDDVQNAFPKTVKHQQKAVIFLATLLFTANKKICLRVTQLMRIRTLFSYFVANLN
jgi:hypothetical protein